MNKKKQNQSGGPKPAAQTVKPEAPTALSREEVAAIAAEVALAQIVKADEVRAAIAKAATESWADAASSAGGTSAITETAQHTPSSAVPSPEMVALIAANLFKAGNQYSVAEAVTNALMLYDAARARLAGVMKLQDAYEREAAAWADISQPEKFPASLGDFLKLIVHAKTPADATKRFRDFLRDRWKRLAANGKIEDYPKWAEWARKRHVEQMTPEERQNPKWAGMTEQKIGEALEQANLEKKVADELADWKRLGFRDQRSWCLWAKEYFAWWANQRSDQARAAAKKSKQPS